MSKQRLRDCGLVLITIRVYYSPLLVTTKRGKPHLVQDRAMNPRGSWSVA